MKPLLEVRHLSFAYQGIGALKALNLKLFQGELVSLVGANGAGKTTLLKLLAGLLVPDEGEILFEGAPLPYGKSHQIIQLGLALSPEGRFVFPTLTVEENLILGGFYQSHVSNKKQLHWCYDFFPRLKERRKQLALTLSGGEQQMLAIGRALMSRPKLLLLDEPNLGIAPILSQLIFEKIEELNEQGMTIFLSEQNAKKALKISSRAYVIELGDVTHEGASEDLLKEDQILSAYLGH